MTASRKKIIFGLAASLLLLALGQSGGGLPLLIPKCEGENCIDRWVSNTEDEGDGSLRAVLWDACDKPKDDAIQFLIWEDITLTSPIAIPADCNGRILLYGRADARTPIEGSGSEVPGGALRERCFISVESSGNYIEHISVLGFSSEDPGSAPGVGICLLGDDNTLRDSSIGFRPDSDVEEGNDIGVYVAGDRNSLLSNIVARNASDGVLIEGSSTTVKGNYIGIAREWCGGVRAARSAVTQEDAADDTTPPSPAPADGASLSPVDGGAGDRGSSGGCSLAPADGGQWEGIGVIQDALDSGSGCPMVSNGGHGIHIIADSRDNTIGGREPLERNFLRLNGGAGVRLDGSDASAHNRISANSFYKNAGLGIDLGPEGVTLNDPGDADIGPNGLQNFPEGLKVVMREWREGGKNRYRFIVMGSAPEDSQVEFYLTDGSTIVQDLSLQGDESGHGEGEQMIGYLINKRSPNTGRLDPFFFELPATILRGTKITALAIAPNGDTSEFAENAILDKDSDHDGIVDILEDRDRDELVDDGESDPYDADSDGDRLADGIEDRDRDGVTDTGETPAFLDDADADGLSDYIETRGDALYDLASFDTDPFNDDNDCDGRVDSEEDTNGNGIAEYHLGESDPRRWDSDGDGASDGPYAGDCRTQMIPDNCPTMPNANQRDGDGDGIGDACEAL